MRERHIWLVVAGLTAASQLAFAWANVDAVSRPDAVDYAQIAREVVEGRGFSSRQAIYSLHVRFLKDHDLLQEPWPNLHRFPLPSLAMAACFLVMGVGTAGVVAYGIGFQVATAVLVFEWARRTIGSVPAIAVVVLLGASRAVLASGVSGMAESPVMFFFTLCLFFLWRSWETRGAASALGAGAALGLATLARTNSVMAAPVCVLALLATPRPEGPEAEQRWKPAARRCAVFVAALFLTIAPWMARNWVVAGNPLFSLHSYFMLPSGTLPADEGNKWDLTLPWVHDFVPPLEYARSHPDRVYEKWTRHIAETVRYVPWFGGLRFIGLIALGGLFFPTGRGLRMTTWVAAGSFVVNAAFVGLTDEFVPRYHYQVLPTTILLGVAVVWAILLRLRRPVLRVAALTVAVAAIVSPAAVAEAALYVRDNERAVDAADMAFVEAHTSPDAVVFSDVSWAVTWQTGRRSVRTHYDRSPGGEQTLAVLRIHDELLPIDAVFVQGRNGQVRAAHRILARDSRFRALFPNEHRFASGAVFYWR